MPQHELLACAQCGCFAFSRFEDFAIRANWGNIEGADPSLRPGMVPTANPALRGGSKLNVVFGVSFMVPSGALQNNRLIDGNLPLQQDLNGPQLQGTGGLRFGWEWRF